MSAPLLTNVEFSTSNQRASQASARIDQYANTARRFKILFVECVLHSANAL